MLQEYILIVNNSDFNSGELGKVQLLRIVVALAEELVLFSTTLWSFTTIYNSRSRRSDASDLCGYQYA